MKYELLLINSILDHVPVLHSLLQYINPGFVPKKDVRPANRLLIGNFFVKKFLTEKFILIVMM